MGPRNVRAFTRLAPAQPVTGQTVFSIAFFVAPAGSRELANAGSVYGFYETNVAATKSKFVSR
jgi:hypothetical protein